MRLPLRFYLTLGFLAVLLGGMGLAAVLSWLAVEQMYISTQRENLLAQASWNAAALQGIPIPEQTFQPYSQVSNIQPGLHTRLIDEQGAVTLKLPISPEQEAMAAPAAENVAYLSPAELLSRPEILQAMQGQAATAVRRVPAAGGRRVLYAAAPILAEAGRFSGIVYLATPLPAGSLPLGSRLHLLGALLFAAALAAVAGAWLARRLAKPLEKLSHAAVAVAAGDLEQPYTAQSDIHELYTLGEAFNTMTASLRRSNQLKTAFIADVTHELRTPLTVLKGGIETLEDGACDDPIARQSLLASMQRESERMIRLVNDLLTLTRADAGALRLNLQPIDLLELAQSRCAALQSLAQRCQVQLLVEPGAEGSGSGWSVLADSDRLTQALDNLLDNAMRHAPADSTVVVRVGASEGQIHCQVCDHGVGIPPAQLGLIFERFYRLDEARDRRSGGSGLGLAIVQALVQAMGGGVSAQSEPGQETAIGFWLPAAQTASQLPIT